MTRAPEPAIDSRIEITLNGFDLFTGTQLIAILVVRHPVVTTLAHLEAAGRVRRRRNHGQRHKYSKYLRTKSVRRSIYTQYLGNVLECCTYDVRL